MSDIDAIAAVTVDRVALLRVQPATRKTIHDATQAASAICPEIPWLRVFLALEASGLIAFDVGNSK